MKCREMKRLLSAYADDELSAKELSAVEAHLAGCGNCRATLEAYRRVGRQLVLVRRRSVDANIKESTLALIRSSGRGPRKPVRRVLLAIPVVAAIVVALMVWQPWTSDGSQAALAKAQAAMAKLTSYRLSIAGTSTEAGTSNTTLEVEFAAPDRYHVKRAAGQEALELILIGNKTYFKGDPGAPLPIASGGTLAAAYSGLVTREAAERTMGSLKNVIALPEETVDGTTCLHYRGDYDFEKEVRATQSELSRRGMPTLIEAEIAELVRERDTNEGLTTVELWIGQDDHLVRRIIRDSQGSNAGGRTESSSMQYDFFDFDATLLIEAPLDTGGQLLPGWYSTSPESPSIEATMPATVDNYDPSAREVEYDITLTNIGTQTLKQVVVMLTAVFPNRETPNGVWYRWGERDISGRPPYTLQPHQSLRYTSTFGFDATQVSPQVFAQYVQDAYLEVSYATSDGQQKVETFRFQIPESIYTLPTAVPPHLVPMPLSPVGEFRFEAKGATLGSSVAGQIGGKRYLFVPVNYREAVVRATPGILILDIEDLARPRKVGYISAAGAPLSARPLAVSGTTLYVSVDTNLWVVDVSDPAVPRGLAVVPGLNQVSMVAIGGYAFFTTGNGEITTMDATDRAHPKEVATLRVSSSGGIGLHVSGSYIFAEAYDKLYAIDASSPSSLRVVGEWTFDSRFGAPGTMTPANALPYHIQGLVVQGSQMYLGLGGDAGYAIMVLDISDAQRMRDLAFLELRNKSVLGPLSASGDRLYVFARGKTGSVEDRAGIGVDFIDISDPSRPAEIGWGVLPKEWSFFEDFNMPGGLQGSYNLVGSHFYWFIANPPNQPVIEIFDLGGQ